MLTIYMCDTDVLFILIVISTEITGNLFISIDTKSNTRIISIKK